MHFVLECAADEIRDGLKKAGKTVLTGASNSGGTWTYIGDVEEGKKNGKGATFYSNGQIERGEFKNNFRHGEVDMIEPNGRRSTGTFANSEMRGTGFRLYEGNVKYKGGFYENQRSGPGVLEFLGGQRQEGNFKAGDLSGEAVIYRADGSVMQRGTFEKNELSVGKRYDANGQVIATVNKPLEEQKTREAAQLAAAEKQRQADIEKTAAEQRRKQTELAEQQRQRDAKAAADKAYQDGLAQMNAGQLFAKADELASAGDTAKAREVLRALVSRFPDHPLAAAAAQQMGKLADSAASRAPQPATPNNSNASVNGGANSANSANSGAGTQIACNENFDAYLNSLPSFRSAGLRTVRQALRDEANKHLANVRSGRAKTTEIQAYRQQMQEYKTAETQALNNHKQLSSAGVGRAMCNPEDGSQAMAWAATRMGIAWNTWAINVLQCSAGQNNPQPLPAFCPY